jgi:hypothetical protein
MTIMNEYQRAMQIHSVLALAASHGQLLTYKQLADYVNLPRFGLGRYLGLVYDFCKTKGYPLLNAIVVEQDTGKPAEGYPKEDQAHHWEHVMKVFQHDWSNGQGDFEKALMAHSGMS